MAALVSSSPNKRNIIKRPGYLQTSDVVYFCQRLFTLWTIRFKQFTSDPLQAVLYRERTSSIWERSVVVVFVVLRRLFAAKQIKNVSEDSFPSP